MKCFSAVLIVYRRLIIHEFRIGKKIWKDTSVACFKALYPYLPCRTQIRGTSVGTAGLSAEFRLWSLLNMKQQCQPLD
jgi:hypothetical protein